MANLKEVRNRISSVRSIQQITKAMKMVSAAKFKRATNAIGGLRPYATKMQEVLANLTASLEGETVTSPYITDRPAEKILLVAITSNKGLAGAFNTNVLKAMNKLLTEKYSAEAARGQVSILTIGKKAYDFYSRRKYNVLRDNNALYQNLTFSNTTEIADLILSGFERGQFDRVELVYNQFKNAAVQVVVTEQMLPVEPPARKSAPVMSEKADYILEPGRHQILTTLIPQMLKLQLYKAVLDSHASEHGARMTSMDKATENAGELLKSLQLSYNQARQAAITTELTEIVSGAAALAG